MKTKISTFLTTTVSLVFFSLATPSVQAQYDQDNSYLAALTCIDELDYATRFSVAKSPYFRKFDQKWESLTEETENLERQIDEESSTLGIQKEGHPRFQELASLQENESNYYETVIKSFERKTELDSVYDENAATITLAGLAKRPSRHSPRPIVGVQFKLLDSQDEFSNEFVSQRRVLLMDLIEKMIRHMDQSLAHQSNWLKTLHKKEVKTLINSYAADFPRVKTARKLMRSISREYNQGLKRCQILQGFNGRYFKDVPKYNLVMKLIDRGLNTK